MICSLLLFRALPGLSALVSDELRTKRQVYFVQIYIIPQFLIHFKFFTNTSDKKVVVMPHEIWESSHKIVSSNNGRLRNSDRQAQMLRELSQKENIVQFIL